jgi:hypothetical protein
VVQLVAGGLPCGTTAAATGQGRQGLVGGQGGPTYPPSIVGLSGACQRPLARWR